MRRGASIGFLTDNNVPDSVVAVLKDRGHDVVRVRDVIAADAPDPIVAETAIQAKRVLVSWDRDFNHQRFKKPRFASLHRIAFCCPEPEGAARLKVVIDRIEYEFSKSTEGRPLLIKIAREKIEIRC